jgi:hypothetical protein
VRFAELGLLALPFVVFIAWRLMAPSGGPPRVLVFGVTGVVAAMVIVLLILWYQETASPGASYVPAQQQGGSIVPSKVVPKQQAPR